MENVTRGKTTIRLLVSKGFKVRIIEEVGTGWTVELYSRGGSLMVFGSWAGSRSEAIEGFGRMLYLRSRFEAKL